MMDIQLSKQVLKHRFRAPSGLIIPFLALLLWELATRAKLLPPSLSASPIAVAKELVRLILAGSLLKHALMSLIRLLCAVSLGVMVGIGSGLLLAESRLADRLLSSSLQFVAPVPVVVWMPFVIMFLGSGEVYKIALASIATYLIVHIHAYRAFKSVERHYLELSQIYQKDWWQRFRNVLLPSALPSIFTALRLTLGIAWIVIFFVEYSSARVGSEGLGWFIADSRALGRVEDEYAGVALLGTLGYLTDYLVMKKQMRTLEWADTQETVLNAVEI